MAWFAACMAANTGWKSELIGSTSGAAGGAMVILEKPGRRIELALYVLAQAIPAAYKTL
jgi:hypothetical protein